MINNVQSMMAFSLFLVGLLLLLVLVRATLMPCKTSPRTAPLPCCQLVDLLKGTGRVNETGRMREEKFLTTYEQRGIGTDTHSILFGQE